jgi:predicted RNA-binding Zn-ribbon protein involved in translation (DUF1610 family)
MSKKDLQKDLEKEAIEPSTVDNVTPQENQTEPPLFYRCVCPECGEDDLKLNGFGIFFSSEFLGVTDGDEFGCGHMELDGDYDWVIECSSCGYSVFDTGGVTLDNLMEWAATHGKAVKTLEFICPICGSQYLNRIEKGTRSVRAVYEILENSETAHAEVALSFERAVDVGISVRYGCLKNHELAKQDGSPVQTPEELVEWLKARSSDLNE